VKGVLDADDAERAVAIGVDGLVVSNHGGRQLDGAPAALDALPAIVDRVGERVEVLMDGGIRRGTDVVKALCLGARAVCIGRAQLYGLAVSGPAGVNGVLNILRDEIKRTLTLMGLGELSALSRQMLIPAGTPLYGPTQRLTGLVGSDRDETEGLRKWEVRPLGLHEPQAESEA